MGVCWFVVFMCGIVILASGQFVGLLFDVRSERMVVGRYVKQFGRLSRKLVFLLFQVWYAEYGLSFPYMVLDSVSIFFLPVTSNRRNRHSVWTVPNRYDWSGTMVCDMRWSSWCMLVLCS